MAKCPEKFRGLFAVRLWEGTLTVRLQNPSDILRVVCNIRSPVPASMLVPWFSPNVFNAARGAGGPSGRLVVPPGQRRVPNPFVPFSTDTGAGEQLDDAPNCRQNLVHVVLELREFRPPPGASPCETFESLEVRVLFKIPYSLLKLIREDLVRPHAFAFERVGFLSCRMAHLKPSGLILLACEYLPVANEDYVNNSTVGAMMGADAIRKALQFALNDVGMFHVHMHDHFGTPRPSKVDLNETAKFVPDFWHVRPEMAHGALILSRDSISGRCWFPGRRKPISISKLTIVGPRLASLWT